jgi:hypothetical protein
MIGTGAAIIGAGLLGAGASIWGANKAADVQKDAAKQAAAVQQQGLDFQKGVFDTQKANYDTASGNLNPFIKTGTGATNLLSSFYGLDGSNTALGDSALASFARSPDYQFAMKEGIGALDNSAASKGGLMSGNQMRAVTEYGSGLATQNLTNYLTRLSGMAGQGIQAGGTLGQLGTNLGTGVSGQVGQSANNIANSTMAGGTAEASGILGTVKGINSGLNSLSLFNQMSKSSYGGGGTGFSLTGTGGLY